MQRLGRREDDANRSLRRALMTSCYTPTTPSDEIAIAESADAERRHRNFHHSCTLQLRINAQEFQTTTYNFDDVVGHKLFPAFGYYSGETRTAKTANGGTIQVYNGVFITGCPCAAGNLSTVYGATYGLTGGSVDVNFDEPQARDISFMLINGANVPGDYIVSYYNADSILISFVASLPSQTSRRITLPHDARGGFEIVPTFSTYFRGFTYFIDDVMWSFPATTGEYKLTGQVLDGSAMETKVFAQGQQVYAEVPLGLELELGANMTARTYRLRTRSARRSSPSHPQRNLSIRTALF